MLRSIPIERADQATFAMARPWSAADERSAKDWVCPFLRAIDEDDRLGSPVEAPHPANRCVALRDPVPQSLRQQELVCLTSGHVNCPRYLRGSHGTTEPLARASATRTVTPATSGAIALFLVAFVASIVFVVANDGMTLEVAAVPTAAASGNVLGAIETEAPTAQPTPTRRPRRARSRPRHRRRRRARARARRRSPPRARAPCRRPSRPLNPSPTREADQEAVVQPVRPADALPGPAGLLDLQDPVRRQPVQHRQLLRRAAGDGPGLESLGGRRVEGRPRPADPAPDPLGHPARGPSWPRPRSPVRNPP